MLVEYISSGRRLIAKIEGGATQYFLNDRLSMRLVMDASGNVAGRQGHMPFGEVLGEIGTTDKHKFTSYEREADTGLDYAINRGYLPTIGRFHSADPYRASGDTIDPRSWNRYSYSLNDPVNGTDRLGLETNSEYCSPLNHSCAGILPGPNGFSIDYSSGGGGRREGIPGVLPPRRPDFTDPRTQACLKGISDIEALLDQVGEGLRNTYVEVINFGYDINLEVTRLIDRRYTTLEKEVNNLVNSGQFSGNFAGIYRIQFEGLGRDLTALFTGDVAREARNRATGALGAVDVISEFVRELEAKCEIANLRSADRQRLRDVSASSAALNSIYGGYFQGILDGLSGQ